MKKRNIITTLLIFVGLVMVLNPIMVMGENTEINIEDNENLVAWYDASQLDYTDGEYVNEWKDLSGNENHVSQTKQEHQPKLIEDEINNLSVVRFSGKQILEANDSLFDGESGITALVVFKTDEQEDKQFIWCDNNDGAMTGQWFSIFPDQFRSRIRQQDDQFGAIHAFSSDDGKPRLYQMTWSTDSSQIRSYIKPATEYTMTTKDTNQTKIQSSLIFAIGGVSDGEGNISLLTTGDIAELILFNKELSDNLREDIEGYLIDKWDIEVE